MAKIDVYGDGTIIDVSRQDFLIFLAQFTEVCFNLAESYICNHASGLADFKNEYFSQNMDRIRRQYLVASEGIKDDLLRTKIGDLIRLLETLSETDTKIIMAYSDELLKKECEIKRESSLKKKVFTHLHQRHKLPPTLVILLAEESGKVIPELDELRQFILNKIQQLMTFEKG